MAAAPARRAPARRAPSRPAPGRRTKTKPAAKKAAAARPVPRGAAVLDALLHGRGWIGLVFVLLAGIVFFNVDLLQMNREIARVADRSAAVKQENARLRADLARLGSSERIQRVAAQAGLVLPAPGEVRYLRSAPTVDARRAAERLRTGKLNGPPVAPVVPVAPEPTTTTPPASPPSTAAPTGVAAPTAPTTPAPGTAPTTPAATGPAGQ